MTIPSPFDSHMCDTEVKRRAETKWKENKTKQKKIIIRTRFLQIWSNLWHWNAYSFGKHIQKQNYALSAIVT